MRGLAQNQALRFLVVGSVGFVIDAGVMGLLVHWAELSPLWARAFSFPLALSVTWLLNRNWTFSDGRTRSPRSQYTIYLFVQLLGLIINYGIFATLVIYHPYWHAHPILALAIGSAAAAIVTFALSRTVAFAAPRPGKADANPLEHGK